MTERIETVIVGGGQAGASIVQRVQTLSRAHLY